MADANCLYPLLKHFVSDSSSAAAVREVVLAPRGLFMRDPQFSSPGAIELNPRDDGHRDVEEYIKSLGLPTEMTETMLKSWEWQASRRMGNLSPPIELQWPPFNYFNTTTILLLTLCESISTLYIGQLVRDDMLGRFLLMTNYGETHKHALQKLEHVHMGAVDPDYEQSEDFYPFDFLPTLQMFHRLPSITTITMDGVCSVRELEPEFSIERIGNIKKLYISRSDIRTHQLEQIMRLPKALEEFTHTTGGLFSRDGAKPYVKSMTIGEALRQHRNTLRKLTLSSEDITWPPPFALEDEDPSANITSEEYKAIQKHYGLRYIQKDLDIQDQLLEADDSREQPPLNGIGSLRDFTLLTHLNISLEMLFGFGLADYSGKCCQLNPKPEKSLVELLPPNLEYLCIYDYIRGTVMDFDQNINELLACKGDKFPRLKSISGVKQTIEDRIKYHTFVDTLEALDYPPYSRPYLGREWKTTDEPETPFTAWEPDE